MKTEQLVQKEKITISENEMRVSCKYITRKKTKKTQQVSNAEMWDY